MRIVALFVLAAWCAECAWGGFTVVDYPVVLLFLGPLYGGAALLIREVARRRGAGWLRIVLLAAAFGLFQAALVDQSLLDRAALAGTQFAEWNRAAGATVVFGVSAEQLLDFVGGHVWLSIGAPIALVEAFVAPEVRHRPWLGRRGLVVAGVLYAAGSAVIWSDSGRVASGAQAAVVLAVCGLLVVAALPRWPVRDSQLASQGPRLAARSAQPGMTPDRHAAAVARGWRSAVFSPLALGAVVLGAHVAGWFFGSQWLGVGLRWLMLLAVGSLVWWQARSQRHVVAVLGAGVLVAAGAAWLAPPYEAAAPWLMVVSDVVVSLTAVTLVTAAFRRTDPAPRRGRVAAGVAP
ncbi:hypothetical protein AMIS_41620 [Actinoplanes missouriensis 431]|uniref:Uncharacterized protein n=1 Tax=Actinoplanes missouriensis (strain ATCC 14538 / DSM 43046 / CBS 188.64 / JCM 3121 / NBRC 102363 / NCIMB 12654 / NRRL B-3342 / UNCC 431) TaxID=512565 RepID=I0H8P5_ACTM4|nr:hypothetical protein [Actinoplanes missouriensis]BAL89382.1 hypothetical protein AMIS_41620 [Actinoplanes missouriensis 431]